MQQLSEHFMALSLPQKIIIYCYEDVKRLCFKPISINTYFDKIENIQLENLDHLLLAHNRSQAAILIIFIKKSYKCSSVYHK